MTPRRPVLIAGPTASGKSSLALALAERDGGVVINADASQVYACWRILTARPDDRELARAPHRLYGHVSGASGYSVGDWLRDVGPAILEAQRAGQRPIIVGGSGLYFHALTLGIAQIPQIPPEIRARSQAMLDAGDLAAMLERLRRDDIATVARIDVRNPMRVQRAWEVLVATGRSLSSWHAQPRSPIIAADSAIRIVHELETHRLNIKIAERFQAMLEQGVLREVCAFEDAGLDWRRPAGQVLGAPNLRAHLRGEITLEAATIATVTATRQFAKRQRTWFRNKMADWPRLRPDEFSLAAIPKN
jgi:tRNA dimethylallyltransferase